MTHLLTSSTCSNRYTYGWRLRAVTLSMPISKKVMSHLIHAAVVSQFSSLHGGTQRFSAHFYHSWKTDHFLHEFQHSRRNIHKYTDSFTLHLMLQIIICRVVTQRLILVEQLHKDLNTKGQLKVHCCSSFYITSSHHTSSSCCAASWVLLKSESECLQPAYLCLHKTKKAWSLRQQVIMSH